MVTRKGQVTIPMRVRRMLKIEPDDRVAFYTEGVRVYLTVVKETLESAYGAVEPLHRPEDFHALRDRAIDDHAAETLRGMGSEEAEERPQP
ncbi:MAG TPA: AbrB/MazE/SpoVT family DNA-binding domain-containing protein [Anaerolineae bacterium]|nr:AbrB/MazE/SpoVT family DNA-binding domain-containing protein [Anaerolineae bacterium]HOQ99059.1 AbrB/MazE/SpoVT family DNA-binding domain-containing protein [Anaerolineae bacterium]